ncbi:MAG TPA: MaoC family dehydratase [Ramlibacter sp.]|nr:MaoC family dehydratase [Ramlibacter sp.]
MAGLHYEDFEVGKVHRHEAARSVTAFDDIWYTCMTGNTQPLHINLDFAQKQGAQGKNLFNSMYTLQIVIGQTVTDLTRGTLVELVALTDVDFPRSVFHDDTLYSRTTVLAKQPPDARGGVVELLHEGYNQHEQLVATCRRKVKVRCKA